MSNEMSTDYIEVESIGNIVRVDSLLYSFNDTFPELLSDFCHKMSSYGLNLAEVFIIPEYFKSGESVALVETQVELVDVESNRLTLPAGSFIIKAMDEISFLALYNMFSKSFTSSTMLFDPDLRLLINRLKELSV